MKSLRSNRFLPLLVMLTLPLASTTTHAAIFWDGGTVAIATDGDGISNGGVGTWDTMLTNWDNGVGPHVAWTQGGEAVFGGTAGIVTLGTNITASTVSVGTTVYNIATPVGTALTLTSGLTNTVGLSSITGVGGVVFSGPQIFNITGGFNFAAPVSGTDTLTKNGPGMVGLGNATNIFSGKIVVNSGRFGFGSDRALGVVPTEFVPDAITLNGGILVNGIPNNVDGRRFNNSGVVTLHANRGITLGESGGTFQAGYGIDGRVTVNGVVSGPGKLTKTDGGSFALMAPNTYTGGTDIQVGAISVGEVTTSGGIAGSNDSLGTGPVNVAAGGQLVIASNGLDIPNDVTLNGSSTVQGRVGALVGSLQSGRPNLTKLSGKLTLAGEGANNVSTWWSDKIFTLAGQITGVGSLQINNIVSTAANNAGGIVVLENPLNDYSGDTVVANNGIGTSNVQPTLRLAASDVIPDGEGKGNVTVNGVLEVAGFNETINALNGTGRVTTDVGKLYLGNLDTDGVFTGTIGSANGGGLVKIGSGTFTLGGTADNGNGRIRVEAGTLLIAKASTSGIHCFGTNGGINYGLDLAGGTARITGKGNDQFYQNSSANITGGTFDLFGTSEGFDGLFGTGGSLTNTGITASLLTLGQNGSNESPAYSGVIQDGTGVIALTKVGNGIQVLGGSNNYTGATTITSGTLAIDGSLAAGSAVSVSVNGSLAGTGTVNGPVNASGRIVPGRLGEIGTLNLGASTISGLLEFEVQGAVADRLNVSGNLDITGAAINLVDMEPTTASKIVIVKYTGNLTGELLPLYLPDGYTLVHDAAAKEIYATNGGVVTETFTTYMNGFAGLSAADKLPNADPDHDGISNLVEYALAGFDPTVASSSVGSLASGTLSFSKRALAVANGDLTYSIQESTTLDSWTTVTPTTDDSTTISYTLPTGRTGVFARLKITRN